MKEERWDLGEESWELEKGDGDGNANGRKEKNDKLDNPKKSHKKWTDRGLLKNTFRHQEAYKMSPKTSPYREF